MANHHGILVCVTKQKTCERLIRKGADMVTDEGDRLVVLHVTKTDSNFLDNNKEGEALDYLFGISKSVGAELFVLKSDKIIETIIGFARSNEIDTIIIGRSAADESEFGFQDRISAEAGGIEVTTV